MAEQRTGKGTFALEVGRAAARPRPADRRQGFAGCLSRRWAFLVPISAGLDRLRADPHGRLVSRAAMVAFSAGLSAVKPCEFLASWLVWSGLGRRIAHILRRFLLMRRRVANPRTPPTTATAPSAATQRRSTSAATQGMAQWRSMPHGGATGCPPRRVWGMRWVCDRGRGVGRARGPPCAFEPLAGEFSSGMRWKGA